MKARFPITLAALGLAFGLALPAHGSQAAGLTTLFVAPAASGTGDCSSPANACGSLATAIAAAGPDANIYVAAGQYKDGPLTINQSLTIVGAGAALGDAVSPCGNSAPASSTVICGNGQASTFTIAPPGGGNTSIAVELDGLVVAGGGGSQGAGVNNAASSFLTLYRDIITGNTASGTNGSVPGGAGQVALGGGLYNAGNAVVDTVQITGNHATGGTGAAGDTSNPPNSLNGGAGGNGEGGGIYNTGMMHVDSTTIDHNSVSGGTAGSGAQVSLPVPAGGTGGAGGSGEGGGFLNGPNGNLYMGNTTIAANSTAAGPGGNGTTVSNGGNGGTSAGAGFENDGIFASLTNNTITTNTAGLGGGPGAGLLNGTPGASQGGGLDNTNSTDLWNDVLAYNTANNDNDDCHGSVSSVGNNWVEFSSGCTGFTAGDTTTGDPKLASLTNNGGFVQTESPEPGSGLIGGGSNTGCENGVGVGFVDARDVARPSSSTLACDIGAVEYAPYVGSVQPVATIGQSGTITVHGADFTLCGTNCATVLVDGSAVPTTPVSDSELQATVTPAGETQSVAVEFTNSPMVHDQPQGELYAGNRSVTLTGFRSATSNTPGGQNTVSIAPYDASFPSSPGSVGAMATAGQTVLAVATFNGSPVTPVLPGGFGYFDVHLTNLAAGPFSGNVFIYDCNLGSATTVDYFDGTSWHPASDQSLAGGCDTITVQPSGTQPSLSQLESLYFAAPNGATVSHVASARATVKGTHVTLRWHLANRAGVLGFNVYAGTQRLNRQIIAVHAGPSYRFRARAVTGARYAIHVLLAQGGEEIVPTG